MTTNPAARGIAASARIAICSGLVAIGLAPFAEGRENTEGPPSLDQVVVTATRLSETLFEANANISVFTQDDIERMHPISIEDTLRTMPGIQFLNYGLPGYNLSRVRINGTDQVLVLVDGVNVTQLGSGVPYPLHFVTDMDNIERIEVLRGSAAVLYGSNAKGGVINIITREAEAGNRTRLTVSAGSYDTRSYRLSNEGTLGDWSYRLNLSRFLQGSTRDADGVEWAGDQEYEKGGAMVSRRLGDSRLTLSFNSDRDAYSFLDHIYDQDVDGRFRMRDVTLTWDAGLSGTLSNTFTARDSRFHNHGILHAAFGDADFWNDHYKSLVVADQLSKAFGDRHVLVVGAEYLETTSLEADFTGGYLSISNRSVFLQHEWQATEGLRLTGGLRLDEPDSERANLTSNLSGSVKIGYRFGPADNAWMAANDYFVLPSGSQLFSVFGNPALLPEKGRNYEIGYSHSFAGGAMLSAHVFQRESRQNIGFDDNARTYTNGEEKAVGADLQLDAGLSETLSVSFAWSFLNYRNPSGTTALGYLPRNLVNAGLTWESAAWNVGLDVRGFLGRDGSDVRSEGWPSDHYWVTNLGVNYRASDRLKLFLKINNVTNTLYAEHTNVFFAQFSGASEWYGMPGRNVLAGMTLTL